MNFKEMVNTYFPNEFYRGDIIEKDYHRHINGYGWIYNFNTQVDDSAYVDQSCLVHGFEKNSNGHLVKVKGNSKILGNCNICGDASILEHATIKDNSIIGGNSIVKGNSIIYGKTIIMGNSVIDGYSIIGGNSYIDGIN